MERNPHGNQWHGQDRPDRIAGKSNRCDHAIGHGHHHDNFKRCPDANPANNAPEHIVIKLIVKQKSAAF